MIFLALTSIFLTILIMIKKNIWNRFLGLSSLTTKVAISMLVLSYALEKDYMADVGVVILMVGGAGVMLLLLLTLESDME